MGQSNAHIDSIHIPHWLILQDALLNAVNVDRIAPLMAKIPRLAVHTGGRKTGALQTGIFPVGDISQSLSLKFPDILPQELALGPLKLLQDLRLRIISFRFISDSMFAQHFVEDPVEHRGLLRIKVGALGDLAGDGNRPFL